MTASKIRTAALDGAYLEGGPLAGTTVVLVHGFPADANVERGRGAVGNRRRTRWASRSFTASDTIGARGRIYALAVLAPADLDARRVRGKPVRLAQQGRMGLSCSDR